MSLITNLGYLRWVSILLAFFNLGLMLIGGLLVVLVSPYCPNRHTMPLGVVTLVALVRILYMIGAAKAQQATAATIVAETTDSVASTDAMIRQERRMRYRRWLWWTRFGMVVTASQFLVALYVMYITVIDVSSINNLKTCFLGQSAEERVWKKSLVISFLVLLWVVVIIQCITGSDVLKWRSFYATHDAAWKAHYGEMFDHGIREALCCMGRVKYMSVLEEDEVYSVARLLGDLVAYRASGTGHLELLAGLALLQKRKKSPKLYEELRQVPEAHIQEAALFHQFSEAAYTGPLLDIGRNPVLFPCAWIHRQGLLTPWSRSRRPVLEGDNWWRGHAAAFLKCINLPPKALRRGRVIQRKREAAYFIVALHDLKSVVITVRGTETPEDLLTDGLCRDCNLSLDDLDGLVNGDKLPLGVRETVLSTFPHYGHSGIVESARELFMQIDGHPEEKVDSPSGKLGFLSSLMGNGCECQGYKLIIVGHSLGGAVATLLGVRLYARYPNLHVYAYGPLPSVDSVIAEACSNFVTSIVYNDEFSSRLSINSILRLRASAIAALADDSSADSALISKLARRILQSKNSEEDDEENDKGGDGHRTYKRKPMQHTIKGGAFLCGHAAACIAKTPKHCASSRVMDAVIPEPKFLNENNNVNNPNFDLMLFEGQTSAFVDEMPPTVEVSKIGLKGEDAEVFLAGLIVHIVPQGRRGHKAFLENRECFKDIVVSPYMFLDHLPWRCHYALEKVLETRKLQEQLNADLLHGEVQV